MEGAKLLDESAASTTPHLRIAEAARRAIEEGCPNKDCQLEQARFVIDVGTSYILVKERGRIGFEEQEVPCASVKAVGCSVCGRSLYFSLYPTTIDETLVEWKPVGFGELTQEEVR